MPDDKKTPPPKPAANGEKSADFSALNRVLPLTVQRLSPAPKPPQPPPKTEGSKAS